MNIGINTRLLLKDRIEGVARYIFEISSRMAASNPEDHFYYFFDRKFDTQFITSDNITPVIIPPQSRHPILWNIWFQYQLPRYLKKYKIDVLFTGETYLPRNTKTPSVIVSHDLAYKHYPEQIPNSVLRYYDKNFEKNHEKADAIIAVSDATKQDIIMQYGTAPEKITVVHNASPKGFKKLYREEKNQVLEKLTGGDPYFVYLGSFHPRKNIKQLISAFELFKVKTNSKYKLVLLGRWAWKTEEIKQKIEQSRYTDDIIVRQESREAIFKFVAAAEALLYVSLFEGFGIPVLEGFSAGVPVITSNLSSMPEVAGDAALLVDPKNAEDIADAMVQVSSNPQLATTLIEKGTKRLDLFSWDTSAAKTYSILKKLVG